MRIGFRKVPIFSPGETDAFPGLPIQISAEESLI